jgi:hypothetical protein
VGGWESERTTEGGRERERERERETERERERERETFPSGPSQRRQSKRNEFTEEKSAGGKKIKY